MRAAMTRDAPHLFDRRRRADRIARALASGAFAGADYLHRLAAERLAERLADSALPVARAAVVGPLAAPFAEAIAMRPGLERVDAAAEPAELEPQAYDAALSCLDLHALDDPIAALAQLRRALKPNGYLLACLFAGESLFELRAAFAEAEPGQPPRVAPMGEIRDLGGLLGRSGFALPVADIERLEIWHASPLALMAELRAMGETSCLAAPLRRPMTRAALFRAVEAYQSRFSRDDGKTRATIELAFLTGWRPGPNMPLPKRPGSATARLADALGVTERSAGEKATK